MKTLCLLLLLAPGAFAVIDDGLDYDVRLTGSNLNAAGFAGSRGACTGGTDWSQQDTAHVTFNGTTVTATTSGVSATVTVSGYTVATTDVCNFVNLASGTNFIPGFYEITAANPGASTWTLHATVSTGAATGMVGNMGGSWATIAYGLAHWVGPHSVLWVKSGTYTQTTAIVPAVITDQTGMPNAIEGYAATHGDLGTPPLITTATNSTNLFTITNTLAGLYVRNINFSNTAGTRAYGWFSNNNSNGGITFDRCIFDGFSVAIEGDWNVGASFQGLIVANSVIKNSTGDGVVNSRGGTTFIASRITANGGNGFTGTNNPGNNSSFQSIASIFDHNTSNGASVTASDGNFQYVVSDRSIYSDNGVSGLFVSPGSGTAQASLTNNIFYANGAYGLVSSSAVYNYIFQQSNAYGANATAARSLVSAGTGDVTLSADPFVARASNNFALNATVGGGAALKGVGYPGSLLSGGTGAADIGALQSTSSGSGAFAFVQ